MSSRYSHYSVEPRPKRGYKKFIFLVLLVVLAGYVYAALNRQLPEGTIHMHRDIVPALEAPTLAWPTEGQAAVGTLQEGVLAASHTNEVQRPIASLAKIITALAVLEKAPMQPGETGIIITLDTEDEDSYWEYVAKDGTVTAVKAGEKINQHQALQAMLLPSSNNMSDSLVRRVFGSMENYTQYANEMVKRYGLTYTQVDDASGFSPQTVSTTSEMIIIGQKALENPIIADIVAQEEAEIPIAGAIPNYNGLLRIKGVTGIKPGNTDEAGNCLLFSARHVSETGQDITVIGVVLGVHTMGQIYQQTERLLKTTQAGLREVEVIRGGQAVGSYITEWGERVNLVAQESVWSYNLDTKKPDAQFQPNKTEPQLTANQPVGQLQLGEDTDTSVQVVAESSVGDPPLLWRLTNPGSLF